MGDSRDMSHARSARARSPRDADGALAVMNSSNVMGRILPRVRCFWRVGRSRTSGACVPATKSDEPEADCDGGVHQVAELRDPQVSGDRVEPSPDSAEQVDRDEASHGWSLPWCVGSSVAVTVAGLSLPGSAAGPGQKQTSVFVDHRCGFACESVLGHRAHERPPEAFMKKPETPQVANREPRKCPGHPAACTPTGR